MRHVFRSHDELTCASLHLHINGLLHTAWPTYILVSIIASSDLTLYFVVQLVARDPSGFLNVGFPPHNLQDVDQATDRLRNAPHR